MSVNKTKMSGITLDKQLDLLPKQIVFCKNCVVSNQRPRTRFNELGICSACQWAYEKDHVVNWEERGRELELLCNIHRSKDGSYDVVVPGSGGKDSGFVAHQLKQRYGMHPLCVTWAPFEYTEIGMENLQNFIASGFDNITGQPNGQLHRKLARLTFELVGDAWQPFTYGQKTWAAHIASKFGIKLVMFGENGELEYGGSEEFKNLPSQGPDAWTTEQFKGAEVDEVARYGLDIGILKPDELNPQTLRWYRPPVKEEFIKSQIEMHWYSYYHKWVPEENYYYVVQNTGFKPNPEGRSEGTYTKYVSLDDKLDGFHWYLSYMKFGMARASRDAQQDIRRHHITREEGVALTRRYDGEFPERHFRWLLDYMDIDEDFFWEVCNFYRGKSNVWNEVNGKWSLSHVVS